MSSRIYPEEAFKREVLLLKMKYLHCPICHSNKLDYRDNNFVLFHDYKCLKCLRIFWKESALSRIEIRNKKIEDILSKDV